MSLSQYNVMSGRYKTWPWPDFRGPLNSLILLNLFQVFFCILVSVMIHISQFNALCMFKLWFTSRPNWCGLQCMVSGSHRPDNQNWTIIQESQWTLAIRSRSCNRWMNDSQLLNLLININTNIQNWLSDWYTFSKCKTVFSYLSFFLPSMVNKTRLLRAIVP